MPNLSTSILSSMGPIGTVSEGLPSFGTAVFGVSRFGVMDMIPVPTGSWLTVGLLMLLVIAGLLKSRASRELRAGSHKT